MTAVTYAFRPLYQAASEMVEQELALATQLRDNTLMADALLVKVTVGLAHMDHRGALAGGARAADLRAARRHVEPREGVRLHGRRHDHDGSLRTLPAFTAEFLPLAERLGNVAALAQITHAA